SKGDDHFLTDFQVALFSLVSFHFWIVPSHFLQLFGSSLSWLALVIQHRQWMKSPDNEVVVDGDGVVSLDRGNLLSHRWRHASEYYRGGLQRQKMIPKL